MIQPTKSSISIILFVFAICVVVTDCLCLSPLHKKAKFQNLNIISHLPRSMRTGNFPLSSSVSDSAIDATAPAFIPSGVTVLKCVGLSKAYTGKPQFDGININLGRGQRIGLIGVNGAGKSTLLRCLAGIDKADQGYVEVAQQTNVVYVDQEPEWGNVKVYNALFSGDDKMAKATRLYYESLAMGDEMDGDVFSQATDAMEEAQAWDYQTLGLTISERLNIGPDMLNRDVSTLSGGERKRVGLANALLRQPDVILLDEPTNHLDMEALEWLSDYLRPGKDKDMTMLLVTHDRYFLEKVCSEVLELDRAAIYRYPGNYAKYLELKEARLQAEDAETDRARTKLRREKEWMVKQPRARQAKSKARQDQFYELVERSKGRTPDARSLELATPEEKDRQTRLGGVVAEFSKAEYAMPHRKLLSDFTYSFRQRDRIGVVGPNGTFLKVLVGSIALQSGTVRVGETVRIGYFEQTGLALDAEQLKQPVIKFVQEAVEKAAPSERPKSAGMALTMEQGGDMGRRKRLAGKESGVNVQFEEVLSSTSSVSERDVSVVTTTSLLAQLAMTLLNRFQFPSKRWYDRVGQLSGGERRRLQLLQVLARQPNVLVLDEPSNDLDLSTLSSLEDYLTEVFDGCLIVVSHDRFFMDRVAEHLFVFQYRSEEQQQSASSKNEDKKADRKQDKKGNTETKTAFATNANANANAVGTMSLSGASSSSSTVQVQNNKASSTVVAAAAAAVAVPTTKTTHVPVSVSASASASVVSEKRKLTYNERKEMQKLERDVTRLGTDLKAIQSKLASSGGTEGYSLLAEWAQEEMKIKQQLDDKETKLLELMELDE
eukprot:gene6571-13295_t